MAAIDKNEISYVDEKSESLNDTKAHQIVQIENFQVLGLHPDDANFYTNYPEEKRKKVIHKIDVRLVPMLAVLYLISHIDRANIGVSLTPNKAIRDLLSDYRMRKLKAWLLIWV